MVELRTNQDTRALAFKERLTRLETERRDIAESIRDMSKEMKGVGLTADEVAGVKLAVRRSFETADAKAKRETVEEFASALGDFADLPIGRAAVERHAA